jgi:hypothetical protein
MSRTYRRAQLELDCKCGAPVLTEEVVALLSEMSKQSNRYYCRTFYIDGVLHFWHGFHYYNHRSVRLGLPPERACNCGARYDYYAKRNLRRDTKSWSKPPKWFKVKMKRKRRAKVRNAMVHERYDDIPFFKNGDMWEWS